MEDCVRASAKALVPIAAVTVGAVAATVGGALAQGSGPSAGVAASCTTKQVNGKTVRLCPGHRGARGPRGPRGKKGPPGPRGAPGASANAGRVVIPRTTIPLTGSFKVEGGNLKTLAKIGPIHIDGLCRKTFSPGTGGGGATGEKTNRPPQYPAPFLITGGETEAKVIVWTESGSLSFKGQVGERINVPPGAPDYTIGNDTLGMEHSVDPVSGEGDHMFVAASNETADETRATDPQVDNYAQLNGARRLNRYPAFNTGSGPIATSTGHLLFASFLAGFDTFGEYDKCVFAGVIHTVS
jgi:hypothetical protein